MEKIKIGDESIYLGKDFLGWKVVHPIKIDGKINWKNLISGGSWIKLIGIIVFVLILLGAIFEVRNIIQIANTCLNQSINYLP
jgi:orotate phosphoribosyltransferase-like protein